MEKLFEEQNNLAKELITTASSSSYIQVINPTTGKVQNLKISDLASVVAAVPEFINFALSQATHSWVGINANDISSLYLADVNKDKSTNWPSAWNGLFINIPFGVGMNMQIVYDGHDALYIRKQWSGVWSSWTKLN